MKNAGRAVTGSVLLSNVIGSVSADQQNESVTAFEEYSWSKNAEHGHDKYYSASYDEYWTIGSGLHNYGGAPTCDKKWEYTFEMDNYGGVRRHEYDKDPDTGWKVDRIGYQWLNLSDAGGGGDSQSIYFTDDPDHLGGSPTEGVTAFEVAEAVFETAAEEAVSAVSKTISGVFTAAELYDKIKAEWSETNTYDDGWEVAWTYADGWAGPAHSDVNHWGKWKYTMEPDSTATHYAEGKIASDGKGFTSSINWEINCDSPASSDIDWPSCASSSSMTASDTSMTASFDKKTRRKYGLQPVPLKKLDAVGFNTEKLLRVPGKPEMAWWASNLDIEAKTVPANETPDRS